MRKWAILILAVCLLLAGCGAEQAAESVAEQAPGGGYPIVETLPSQDGVYTAEARTCRTYAEVFVRHNASGAEWKFTLPDGGPIPEYTFLPEDWGDWLEPNTLLVTVGQGGDAGEQHTYRCSLEMQDRALAAASVLEQTGEALDADYDFTHDGQPDTLERMTVLDPDTGEPMWHELWVRNGDGERIWGCSMAAGGPSWETTLFAVEADGEDCLLELVTGMGQGHCSYFYEVFALSETGERVSRERGEVQFDVNFGSPIHESFDCAAIADFLWRVKELTATADAILLDMDGSDGLRCMVSPEVFTHDYHCGEFVALESREAIEAALEQKLAAAELVEVLPGTYDFNHDGKPETLEVVGNGGESMEACTFWVLRLKDAEGKILWSDCAATSHAGWNSIFACEIDGQDYLLRYDPSMSTGLAYYVYELFSLCETGEVQPRQTNAVEFDVNFGSAALRHIYDPETIAAFLEEVHGLLENSTVLITTENFEFATSGSGADFWHDDFTGGLLRKSDNWAQTLREYQTEIVYGRFLEGDLSAFASADIEKWGLSAWPDTILLPGKLEYTYLDLDGDGREELLVQSVDAPENYNGVFHEEDGRLCCWQNDASEGGCRDYPLKDGTMVRQYDVNGAATYTLFRYRADGGVEELARPNTLESSQLLERSAWKKL